MEQQRDKRDENLGKKCGVELPNEEDDNNLLSLMRNERLHMEMMNSSNNKGKKGGPREHRGEKIQKNEEMNDALTIAMS